MTTAQATANFSPQHVDALTSPRFLFGLYVLIKHSGYPALLNAGLLPTPIATFMSNAEVSISYFFTMSGFVLAYVYYGKFTAWSAVKRYGIARFARVYPVFLLSLILMMPFVPWKSVWIDLPQLFLLQSWLPLALSDGHLVSNWNMQSWTLSVELACYLAFPWLMRVTEALSTWGVLVALVAICALMFGLRLPSIDEPNHVLFEFQNHIPFPLLRAPEFYYGVLLGALYRRGAAPTNQLALHVLIVVTLLLLCFVKSLWLGPVVAVLCGLIVLLLTTSIEHAYPLSSGMP